MYIWQLSAIQLNEKTLLTGTILEGRSLGGANATTPRGNFLYIIRSYFQSRYSNQQLTIRSKSEELITRTDQKGYFLVLLNKTTAGEFKIIVAGKELEIPQAYPVFFSRPDTNIEVVSDIDDTIILSHTASLLKRVYTILFELPKKREAIVFTHHLLQNLEQQDYRVTYLSKSESNLFGLITSIFQYRDLPEGALLLTPYLKFHQLFKPNKGKTYKLKYLKLLMDHLPDKRFILLGDDSQRDMEVYTSIVGAYADRIVKVYIRQTGFTRNAKQREYWDKLSATGVDAVYFKDSDSVEPEIAQLKSITKSA